MKTFVMETLETLVEKYQQEKQTTNELRYQISQDIKDLTDEITDELYGDLMDWSITCSDDYIRMNRDKNGWSSTNDIEISLRDGRLRIMENYRPNNVSAQVMSLVMTTLIKYQERFMDIQLDVIKLDSDKEYDIRQLIFKKVEGMTWETLVNGKSIKFNNTTYRMTQHSKNMFNLSIETPYNSTTKRYNINTILNKLSDYIRNEVDTLTLKNNK